MGNMDPYINLSVKAHGAGGPDQLLEQVFAQGRQQGQSDTQIVYIAAGVIVGSAVTAGIAAVAFWPSLRERFGPKRGAEISEAVADAIKKADKRPWCTVTTAGEFAGDLALQPGDRFRALTRSGGVVQIQVDGRDEAYYVPGSELEAISDFVLDSIDEL